MSVGTASAVSRAASDLRPRGAARVGGAPFPTPYMFLVHRFARFTHRTGSVPRCLLHAAEACSWPISSFSRSCRSRPVRRPCRFKVRSTRLQAPCQTPASSSCRCGPATLAGAALLAEGRVLPEPIATAVSGVDGRFSIEAPAPWHVEGSRPRPGTRRHGAQAPDTRRAA